MSNARLDNAAQIISTLREQPHVAALGPVEQAVIDQVFAFAPDLDRRTVGAAWMLLGDAIAQLANNAGLAYDQAVNLTQLAGQRLYTETGREIRCPQAYSSGKPCTFVAKSLHEVVLDAQMRAHYSVYHPGATWPPEHAGIRETLDGGTYAGPASDDEPELLPAPDPFSFDEGAWAAYNAQQLRLHWHDMTMPWPLERLREFTQLSDELPAGSTDRWQEAPARVADIRAAFEHIADLERQVREARHLAESLYAFECRGADWPNTLEEFNPDLEHALLPKWLSGEPDAPETWQTPHANAEAEREAGMDATYEHDPDLGKDLDYDDEDQDDGHDYPADGAPYGDGYADDEYDNEDEA